MTEFERAWRKFHGDHRPIGYMLRYGDAPNWLRFHSLPDSKRYPETADEWTILLDRQNELATEVLGANERCWLVQAHWQTPEGEADLADEFDPFWATREYGLTLAFKFAELEGDEPMDWLAYATPMAWEPGRLDALLRRIADEEAGPTLWMSEATGVVFAPYDGGVDLFLATGADVAALSVKHSDWLSDHPSGL